MIVTLVRHSQVIHPYQNRYNGHIDIPLSEKGVTDAKVLAKRLSSLHFDKVYSSDLLRARQTLDAFKVQQEVIYTQKLREKSWGRHEGKSFEEIREEGIEYIDFEQWIEALDGEDFHLYTQKIQNYFYETLFTQELDSILIVTHAGVIRTLLSIIKKISLEEAFSIPLPYSSFITLDTQTMQLKE